MTKVNVKKLYKYWRHGSDLDFQSSQDIALKARQYVQASFFLHLSLEKALKASIVLSTESHAPYSHNLSQLAKLSGLPFSNDQLALLLEVNDFNLRCRYPDEKYNIYKKITKSKSEKLIDSTGKLRVWIFEQSKK